MRKFLFHGVRIPRASTQVKGRDFPESQEEKREILPWGGREAPEELGWELLAGFFFLLPAPEFLPQTPLERGGGRGGRVCDDC